MLIQRRQFHKGAMTRISALFSHRVAGVLSRGLAGLSLLLVCAVGAAQATGTISGLVSDAGQAVIPNAKVTVTNQNTNVSRTVESNSSGEFTVTLLPSGTYTVQAEKDGFATSVQKNVQLSANTTAQANLQMAVGATDQLTVSTDASLVQSTSTVLTQVVDQKRIEDLPLNGRNVLDLMEINAGVSNAGAAGQTSQIQNLGTNVVVSINGSRGDAVNFLLDNGDNNDYYAKVALPFPNPDAVKEFSIQTASFDARYARSGGIVNVITKNGTNTVHGSLFEYVRNYAMNAKNYFSGRDTLKRNQFGGSLGGPMWLPKIYNGKDKTFLFFAYQGTRTSYSTPAANYTTPSQAMKNGDFSSWLQPCVKNSVTYTCGRIIDPLTNLPFTNNQIPVSRFDPVAVKILNLMPNSPGSGNYTVGMQTPAIRISQNELMGRADHQLTQKQHLFFRAFQYFQDQPWSYVPTNIYTLTAGQKAHSRNLSGNWSYVFSTKWLNEFNYAHNVTESNSATPAEVAQRSLQGLGARVKVVPGQETFVGNISGWSGINIGQGYHQVQKNDEFTDVLNFVNGHHDLRIGGYYRRYSIDKTAPFSSGGTIAFNGLLYSEKTPGGQALNNAGNAFAEFVLGKANSFVQQYPWSEYLTNNYIAVFAQDDWRVTPRLTVNLGLRWDPQTDYTEHQGAKSMTFVPGYQSKRFPNAPKGLVYLGDPGYENWTVKPNRKNFAPRAGFNYQIHPTTVFRAAYGMFYDMTNAEVNNRVGAAEPFIRLLSLSGPLQMSDPFNGGTIFDPTPTAPSTNFVFDPYSNFSLQAPNMPTPYMQNWNAILEQQIGSTLLRIGYVGSKGTHLLTGTQINAGVYAPGATTTNINARRPYQPIGTLTYDTDTAWSRYNSLQVTVQKRMSHGFSILGNYTWGKSIDIVSGAMGNTDTSGPDPSNPLKNKGVSDFDIRHRMVVSGIWELPSLRGHNAIVRGVLGGWQTNYIFSNRTGVNDTVLSGSDNAASGVAGQFADVVPGQLQYLPKGRSKSDRIAKWFNTSAFTANAVGTPGNSSRNIIRDPASTLNLNFSLFKKFPIYHESTLQFRAEAFNLLNHANLGAPNLTVNSANYGKITTASDPRIMQLALRLAF